MHAVLEPSVDIDVYALRDPRPSSPASSGRPPRRRPWLMVTLVAMVAGLIGAGLWWNRTVTSNPQLGFDHEETTRDRSGSL